MKKQTKATLIALAIAGVAATSHAAAYNNDLIIGFSSTTGNDLLYDLGSFGSLTPGKTWDLSSLLGSYNLSTVNWGVIGNTSVNGGNRTIYTTFNGTPATVGAGTGSGINTATLSLYNNNFTTAGAGQFAQVSATDDNSWNHQTINPTTDSDYVTAYENPNRGGTGAINFYSAKANSTDPVQDQFFTLDSSGIVTFGTAAVPEPSTYGLFAGAGLLAVCLRNQFRRKQA
ncbi:MAG TPA: PEP-CTERM sorting domain-containing protein [Verrucomicrobiae bacterium]|jgi:hypothetical protein|nr:PEP-CTERM sorting domain-containing protein [Verrucomicrobiae bacterium]